MHRIGVVGAGTMGIGVSQLFAEGGYDVVLVDTSDDILDRARTEITRNVRMAPLVRPSAPRRRPEEVVGRIRFTTDLTRLKRAEYVIENVTEQWEVKRPLYRELDAVCPPDVCLGVNTSAIPITRIASLTGRPARVVGTHFMNPAPLMPTVEVIRGHHTSRETIERTTALLDDVGKDHVVVEDSPGFVTNRVLMLTINEAVFLLHEGVASATDVDRLFKECFGHAMGPLETADLIGLDTVLRSLDVLHDGFGDPKYRPCPLLRRLVDAGLYGRKAGRGFHSYEPGHAAPAISRGDQCGD
ncbi:3-hydroxyacyl-CoA dehydrogenase family protein [Actinoallomurus sp. CA-142502]|uniref:3-hydroxyacyl-CoA dehydrogenase family protein n=1 Tax=Actinoallomurus sp. CA-142502 TaxID=3239885 RepID=UPI003D8CEC67